MIFEQDAGDVARFDTALAQDVASYETMVRRAVSVGQLLTAIEVARDGLRRFGASPALQQQLALALAQTGALDAAREILGELKKLTPDEETLCLLGRVQKEVWRRAPQAAEAAEALRQACAYYGEAFERHGTYYPGINLAFTLAAAGELARAEACAGKVAAICRKEIARPHAAPDGWLLASLAEALVHQGATAEAAEYYRKAASVFQGRWRDLASMRRQAREVLGFYRDRPEAGWTDVGALRRRALGWLGRTEKGEEWLDRCFAFPSVVVFSGHMIDAAGRVPPRFPPEREAAMREQIRLHLLRINAGFGYASAAAGGDILFCECLLEMEAKVNLVLPCSVEAFKRQSVSFAGAEWEKRFHHVLANATTVLVANPMGNTPGSAQSASAMDLVFTNRIATGMAALQARALNLELQAIALWDGQPAMRPGGTASVVSEWQRRKIQPHIIAPGAEEAVSATDLTASATEALAAADAASPVRQEIKAMLFAEAVNFHKIGEAQMPAYVAHFKGAIARRMAEMNCTPVVAESWAGIHYFIYDAAEDAARFALAFRDLVVGTPWAQHGLPADLGVRIVVHAGPVFAFNDPTLRRLTCVGAHVNRAARIEPLTPTGQVYVTQEFAALCGAEGVDAVTLEYLGYMRTTTLFEDAALYRLDHAHEPAPDRAAKH
ncbi:MAG TPA: TRAFs-binding domain-containing protein [Opitutaceae bacterium]|nr:TRAFs-binding domain-containing protein [Opitutaceae bacterium]